MSNPNWPDDSQQYPGAPGQQPGSPAPVPADPNAPGQMGQPFGQPPMMPPTEPYGQPPQADPFGGQTPNPPGTPPPAPSWYGQQPSSPGYYGTPPSAPMTPTGYPQPAPGGFEQTNPGGVPPMPQDPYSQPSTPLSPYGYPGTPSQQIPGYPGSPSQGLPGYPGSPSQGLYGQPQWGPPSQGFPGGAPAPKPKRSKKPLIIALSIVAILLLLAGGGAAYVVTSLGAPAAAAVQFCGDLKTQNYTAAYGMFSSKLQSTYSSSLFTQGAQELDQVEGTVTQCDKASGSTAYNYSFGASSATLQAVITRSKSGQLTGVIKLTNENSGWKVDAMDTSLLGVNLGALQAVGGFCQALQTKNYDTAYGFLGANPQSVISQSDFVTNAQLDDKYDGPLTACSLLSLGTGNTDIATSLTVSVTRSNPGTKTGSVTMDVESGAWKINTIDTSILGTDYRPLLVAQQFCTDYQKSNFAAAYGLMASDAGVSQSDFTTFFQLPSGFKVTECTLKLDTYKVSGSSASMRTVVKVVRSADNASVSFNTDFQYVLESGSWKIAGLPSVTLA